MASKARMAAAVAAGAIVWAVLWVGGSAIAGAIWPDIIVVGQRLEHTGALLGHLSYSVLVSLASGYLAARLAHGGQRAVQVLAGIQLTLGLAIEIGGWDLAPGWYHVAFLVLLVPAILVGGSLAGGRSGGAAQTARTRAV